MASREMMVSPLERSLKCGGDADLAGGKQFWSYINWIM